MSRVASNQWVERSLAGLLIMFWNSFLEWMGNVSGKEVQVALQNESSNG